MIKYFAIVGFLILGTLKSFSIGNYPAGARALGLSNAVVSVSDTWSGFHNQAGLAVLADMSAAFYYESRFQVEELSLVAGAFVLPTRTGNFGLGFLQFGKGTFKENKIGIAFAKSFSEKFSAGIQFDYLSRMFPENQRAQGLATFEGGVVYSPFDDLFLGAHVFNPISAGIESVSGKIEVPAVFRIGGHYRFDEMVLVLFETEKETHNPLIFKSGIEFSPIQNLALRFGVSGKPFQYTAGIGYSIGKISTDIGFGYHGNLGVTPSVSIQFIL